VFKKVKIDATGFQCSKIKEHLVPIELGKGRVRRLNPLVECRRPAPFRCLICGDAVSEWSEENGQRFEMERCNIEYCGYKTD